jgi:hypothetical protein
MLRIPSLQLTGRDLDQAMHFRCLSFQNNKFLADSIISEARKNVDPDKPVETANKKAFNSQSELKEIRIRERR